MHRLPDGVLVLHGLTGTPQSMEGLAAALAARGLAVEVPLLPGHGTTVDDLLTTSWDDWSAAAEAAYIELAARCDGVVVAALSMGGSLALWLAGRHPSIAALVLVNPAVVADAEQRDGLVALLDAGITTIDGIGNDIADPDAVEIAYDQLAVAPTLSLFDALDALDLGAVRCPVLLFTSRQDHVVDPASADALVAGVSGPVERVFLERSFHVATLDFDRDEIERRAAAFVADLFA